MSIAIAIHEISAHAKICEVFARAPYFAIANTDVKTVIFFKNPYQMQPKHISQLLINDLMQYKITTVIAGNFGTQAIEYLNSQNIDMIIISDSTKTLKDIIKLIQHKHLTKKNK